MNKVRILISGMAPKDVRFNLSETLGDLIERSSMIGLPLEKVSTWLVDGQPIGNTRNVKLTNGMVLAGQPKHIGG
jgi:hypothetical protein